MEEIKTALILKPLPYVTKKKKKKGKKKRKSEIEIKVICRNLESLKYSDSKGTRLF